MQNQISNTTKRLSVLAPVAGVLALAATGIALAAPSAPASHVYMLKASLTPTQNSPVLAKGHFDAVLVGARAVQSSARCRPVALTPSNPAAGCRTGSPAITAS